MSAVLKEDARSIAELIADQKAGYSLQQRFYTDPAIYELELELIIYRNWIFAGHESQLPAPGDFRVLSVAGESAIISMRPHTTGVAVPSRPRPLPAPLSRSRAFSPWPAGAAAKSRRRVYTAYAPRHFGLGV